jgi:15,16-dihydrobiliverdin:ferredoxin oxidoreductase
MKTEHIVFLTCLVFTAESFAPSSGKSSFLGRSSVIESPVVSGSSSLRMDTESYVDAKALESLELIFREQQAVSVAPIIKEAVPSIEEAEAKHGMPWKSSINSDVQDELLYMPFWDWHMSFMKDNLTGLRALPCSNGKTDFSYNENTNKKAGDNTQVYNAVFYPDPKYNLPVLGIDLLAFNRKKYLTIVDFQPLHDDEEDHAMTFEDRLKPIKEQYDSLKGRMSSKFYDETKFFSQEMLFARFEDEEVVSRDLFPAFQAYVQTHLEMIRETTPEPENADFVMERQKAYDTYSAERDPATGLFAAMYGNDWAQDFVHDFLFSMSTRKEGNSIPSMPFMGGPPKPSAGAASQPQQRQPQVAPFVRRV